jgi:predicted site-specific integrase-resolvase
VIGDFSAYQGVAYMPVSINDKKFYRTSEVCQIARISRSTLLRWLKEESLAIQDYRDRRSWRLFTEADVNKLTTEANRIYEARVVPSHH